LWDNFYSRPWTSRNTPHTKASIRVCLTSSFIYCRYECMNVKTMTFCTILRVRRYWSLHFVTFPN
jgi:hypothetical protein